MLYAHCDRPMGISEVMESVRSRVQSIPSFYLSKVTRPVSVEGCVIPPHDLWAVRACS